MSSVLLGVLEQPTIRKHDARPTGDESMIDKNTYHPRYVSDREAERVATMLAGIRRRAKRRERLDQAYTGCMFGLFSLLGVAGVVLLFELVSFIWGLM